MSMVDAGAKPARLVTWGRSSTHLVTWRRRPSRGWRKHVRRQKQAARLALFR